MFNLKNNCLDPEGLCNKKKLYNKFNLNNEYINHKIIFSNYKSTYLNNENDNIINNNENYNKLINITKKLLDIIKKITNDKEECILYYNIGYNIRLLEEIIPYNFKNTILLIKKNISKSNWNEINKILIKLLNNLKIN